MLIQPLELQLEKLKDDVQVLKGRLDCDENHSDLHALDVWYRLCAVVSHLETLTMVVQEMNRRENERFKWIEFYMDMQRQPKEGEGRVKDDSR